LRRALAFSPRALVLLYLSGQNDASRFTEMSGKLPRDITERDTIYRRAI
jgi:hypothetical protein